MATYTRLPHWLRRVLQLSLLDGVAIGFALLLSVGCLANGSKADSAVALLLLCLLPLLLLGLVAAGPLNMPLAWLGLLLAVAFMLILVLQQMALPQLAARNLTLHDAAGWWKSVGRALLLALSYLVALLIGSHATSARLFLQTVMVAGTLMLASTFFLASPEAGAGALRPYFSHGFVNANTASAYIALLLVLVLAQAARSIRLPSHYIGKYLIDQLDQLELSDMLLFGFLVFALLLCFICLFMTGSRGGVMAGLSVVGLFCSMMVIKMQLSRGRRRIVGFLGFISACILLLWVSIDYGQMLTQKFSLDGMSPNHRLEIYAGTLRMIADYPLLGTGLGSFPYFFQQYRPADISSEGWIDKAHNSYLEFAAEMGLPALLVLLLALGMLAQMLWRGFRNRHEHYVMPTTGFCTLALGAMLSLVDFPLQLPALGALFLAILIVCATQCGHHANAAEAPPAPQKLRSRRRTKRKPI